ncbi:Bile salt export pump [Bienertia sinuspersici]
MGWTVFACFGCTKKRKRPKIRRQRIQGYEELQSDVQEQDVSESLSIPREKLPDEKKAKIRKKVRFNLDVVTYEPLSSYEEDHDNNLDERSDEETEQVTAAACLIATESNYRYNNCYDGEDEHDDDDECQISEDDDDGSMVDLQSMYYEEICSSKPLISSATARLRSHYIVPVLNPIENLSQWKAIKTRKC